MRGMDSTEKLKAKIKQVDKSMRLSDEVPEQTSPGIHKDCLHESNEDIKLKVWLPGCKKQATTIAGTLEQEGRDNNLRRNFDVVTFRVRMEGRGSHEKFKKLCQKFYASGSVAVEAAIGTDRRDTYENTKFVKLTMPQEPKSCEVVFDAEFWVPRV